MTFYEFFCGGGMARTGLGANWTCAFANDNNAAKMRSYVVNFGRGDAVLRDVACLTTADLPGSVSLAWCSFPCKDTSLAGDRAGLDGARSGTFWPFWRLMQGLRAEGRAPKLIVIENPCGLLTSHDGADIDAICDALAHEGYCYGAVMLDAVVFTPQSRKRVFVVGVIDDGLDLPVGLFADRPSLPFQPPQLAVAMRRQKTAPIWWRLPVPPQRNAAFVDILEDEPRGVPWHTQAETDRILGMMAPPHLAKVEAAKHAGKRMVGALYRRTRDVSRWEVRFDDVAGCLRVPTGGSSRQTIMIVEGASVRSRLLSPLEAARLMGLADDYQLPSNYNDAYGLMGDGVVVPVVRHLAEHILEPVLLAQRDSAADAAKPIAAQ